MAAVTASASTPVHASPRAIAIGVVAVGGLLALAPSWLDLGSLRLVAEILFVFTMAQMWNLLAGYVGVLSFGHQGFVGIGAYALFTLSNRLGWSPFLCLPLAFLVCALVAALIAPFLFRLRDAYFSIAIWVLAEILRIVVSQSKFLGSVYGLPLQMARSMDRTVFNDQCYWWAVGLAVGSVLLLLGLLRTRLGLSLMAVRDNEAAAASAGIDVWRSRFVAFVLSAAGCGLAGAAYYASNFHVEPGSGFDVNWVVTMLFIVIIGGIGTIEGPMIGTAVYFALRALFGEAGNWYLILMGAVAVAAMVAAPKGIWGTVSARIGLEIFSVRRIPPSPLSAPAETGRD